jgi:hypothetical protein
VLEVLAEGPVARHRSRGGLRVADQLVERRLAAIVGEVHHQSLVEMKLLGTGGSALSQPLPAGVGQRGPPQVELDQVRGARRLLRDVPERPGRVEGLAQAEALGLDPLLEERVPVDQLPDRLSEGPLGVVREEPGVPLLRVRVALARGTDGHPGYRPVHGLPKLPWRRVLCSVRDSLVRSTRSTTQCS